MRMPFLSFTATSLTCRTPREIVTLYAKRMQIEEAFRDLKCLRYGLGFELHLSRSRERIAALLLIAALAFYALWLIGSQAIARGLLTHYQSNTRRTRPVLSLFNLAIQVVRHATDQLLAHDLPHLLLPVRSPQPICAL